ncbi:methyltransferase domain-containing protein [Deinococcus aluminii]|uniref:Carboxy-S-adenosyl-L-methionine synthase n=1 Tax=Deinococcus aluminii TaxID=1656885 RepID=A0ABP9XHG7_9DEIO
MTSEQNVLVLGEGLEGATASWTFSGKTAEVFDQHVSKSVPAYESGHHLIVRLSDFFVRPDTNVYEIGCSTATLTAKLAERHRRKRVHIVGIDIEADMVAAARTKCEALTNVSIVHGDAQALDFEHASLIVMYYTLQFIPLRDRPSFLEKLYGALIPGGAILLFEKTVFEDGEIQDLISQVYHEHKMEQGYSSEEILGKSLSLRGVLQPCTSIANQRLLRTAGFSKVAVIHKQLAFEGYLAIKGLVD